MAKKKEETKQPTTEIVKPDAGKTVLDTNSNRQVVNWNLLEPAVRDRMVEITNNLKQAFISVRTGFLEIGKQLSEAELIMKPRGLWVAYLNGFPNFKQAQAYRYINGFRIATNSLPEKVLEVVLSTGMDMIGTKDRPFGKYQDVVKQLPPPKNADIGKATAWLNQVEAKYKESRKRENKVVNSKSLQIGAFKAVLRNYKQVPEKGQLQWIRGLFGYVLGSLGMKGTEEIIPQTPPAEFIKNQEADKAAEEPGE